MTEEDFHMNGKLAERFVLALTVGVIIFIVYSTIFKLYLGKENWLSVSILDSIALSVACFAATWVDTLKYRLWKIMFIDTILTIIVWIVVAFITGVVLNLPNWDIFVNDFVSLFGISLLLHLFVNKLRK